MFHRKMNDAEVVIPLNCERKASELSCTLEEKFRRPNFILHLTGLCFEDDRPIWRYLKFTRAILLFLLVVYQTVFILLHLIKKRTFDKSTTLTLVFLNWHFQATLSMGFLIYWQLRGYMKLLRENVHCPKGCHKTVHVMNQTLLIYFITFSLLIIVGIVDVILAWSGYFEDNQQIDWEVLKMYNTWIFAKLHICIIVYFYAFYVLMAVLTCFVLVVRALQNEFEGFNCKLQKIGSDNSEDKEKIAEELAKYFMIHVDLTSRIRIVYTFSMIGSNIPTTIVCLLNLFMAFQLNSYICMVFSCVEIGYCFLELFGLTSAPAKIHEVIRNVEGIIYGNIRIWIPYNDKVYQLASVFIAHANQYKLGITLWGFAVVTKPLILTTISLTVTYLTFILQMNYEEKDNFSMHNQTTIH